MVRVAPVGLVQAKQHVDQLWVVGVGTALLLSLAFKLYLAATTVGTSDVGTWAHFAGLAQRYGGAGLYQQTSPEPG